MKSPHWRSVVVDTHTPDEAEVVCHASFGVAVNVLRQRFKDAGGTEQVQAAHARLSSDDFAPDSGDPARSIGTGPSLVVSGVVGAVIGCDGEWCEFELEVERTYTAFNGHRMTARLQRHPRTGAVVYDYKGDPKYSQVDAQHAEDCPCPDPEEGDGGADFEAVQRWEFPGDYE